MRITPIRRAVAAGASVAVATVGLAAFAPTAQAASGTLKYTCAASIYVGQKFTVTVDTDLPATVEQGSTTAVKITASVVVPESSDPTGNPGVLEALRNLTVANVDGSAEVESTLNDVAQAKSALTIPKTAVPATGPLTIVAQGAGPDFKPTTTGTHVVKAGAFTGSLTLAKADGTPPIFGSPAVLNCVPDAGQDLTVDTVEVTKATVQATKTTAKVKYAKKAKKATATIKVVNKDKTAAKGKVKLVLKKGKKVVGTKTVKLNAKGQAKGVFKKLKKKGKYTLVAQYQGNKNSKKSKKIVTFRVR